jgi:putative DNA methylase
MRRIDPQTFATLLTPKEPELIASPTRHGSVQLAEDHFRAGFGQVFKSLHQRANSSIPITVYYAFKQEEDDNDQDGEGRASTGWETMLEGLVDSGFQITGTWPVRTTKKARAVAQGANALASAVVLVARQRTAQAPMTTRREFITTLKRELPSALSALTQANIAPVDLAQASIGPGIAVFTRFSKVLESSGNPMSVRTALQLINQALDEVLAEQESEYDSETRWAVAWFEQFGIDEGAYGTAETLSKAKNTSVTGMDEAGVTISRAGQVRLLRRDELPDDWDPTADKRLTVWEVAQHLIHALETGGEVSAAKLFRKVGGLAEVARDLAYRLYTTSERKGWTQEAIAYNSLVVAWPEIKRLASTPAAQASGTLFDESSSSNEQ